VVREIRSGLATPSVTLTDASTVTVDASFGNHFRLLTTSGIGATRAMGAPSNPTDGQKIIFEIIQDGSGSRAVTWNSIYTFSTDIPSPTMTTTLNKRDFVGFVYNSTANLWYCLAVSKGY
jgi:hypothetical protein